MAELLFWRYEAAADAIAEVKTRQNYILTSEDQLDRAEKLLRITIQRKPIPLHDPEVLALQTWIGFSPEVRLAKRRAELAEKDPDYARLVAEADAAVDKATAAAKRAELTAIADALVLAEDAAKEVAVKAAAIKGR